MESLAGNQESFTLKAPTSIYLDLFTKHWARSHWMNTTALTETAFNILLEVDFNA